MIKINSDNKLIQKFMSFINHYDHDKYWRRREVVVNPNIKASKLKRLYYLYYVKKVDSYWHCSFGTGYMTGSQFLAPPHLMAWPKWYHNGIQCYSRKKQYYLSKGHYGARSAYQNRR